MGYVYTIAALADGTPLVTRKAVGAGQVVLFHVTANADWSTLPLSGLFVQMLERLAVSSRAAGLEPGALDGKVFTPDLVLDGFGQPQDPGSLPGVKGEALAAGQPGPDLLPGLYAGEDRRVALNVMATDAALAPAVWPAGVTVEGLDRPQEQPLKGAALALGLALLLADTLAALALSGRLPGLRAGLRAALVLGMARSYFSVAWSLSGFSSADASLVYSGHASCASRRDVMPSLNARAQYDSRFVAPMSIFFLSPSSFRVCSVAFTRESQVLRASTSCLRLVSSAAWLSASRTMRSISSLARPLEGMICIACWRFVALSRALTLRIPWASMSNDTSICGTPRGVGGNPSRMKRPRLLLSPAIGRSPCTTWISTWVWLSPAVENTWLFLVGMVVLRSMSGVATPPNVSMPSVSGVTSRSTTSLTLSISEQCSIDQPPGIRQAVELLTARRGDLHAAHLEVMECLGRMIWESQRSGRPPDGQAYIDQVRRRATQD